MGLNLAAMEKITADVQMNDLKWVEVGEGSYFKVLTVHEPTNTVAFSYKICLLYTSPSPRDLSTYRMPSSA